MLEFLLSAPLLKKNYMRTYSPPLQPRICEWNVLVLNITVHCSKVLLVLACVCVVFCKVDDSNLLMPPWLVGREARDFVSSRRRSKRRGCNYEYFPRGIAPGSWQITQFRADRLRQLQICCGPLPAAVFGRQLGATSNLLRIVSSRRMRL